MGRINHVLSPALAKCGRPGRRLNPGTSKPLAGSPGRRSRRRTLAGPSGRRNGCGRCLDQQLGPFCQRSIFGSSICCKRTFHLLVLALHSGRAIGTRRPWSWMAWHPHAWWNWCERRRSAIHWWRWAKRRKSWRQGRIMHWRIGWCRILAKRIRRRATLARICSKRISRSSRRPCQRGSLGPWGTRTPPSPLSTSSAVVASASASTRLSVSMSPPIMLDAVTFRVGSAIARPPMIPPRARPRGRRGF